MPTAWAAYGGSGLTVAAENEHLMCYDTMFFVGKETERFRRNNFNLGKPKNFFTVAILIAPL